MTRFIRPQQFITNQMIITIASPNRIQPTNFDAKLDQTIFNCIHYYCQKPVCCVCPLCDLQMQRANGQIGELIQSLATKPNEHQLNKLIIISNTMEERNDEDLKIGNKTQPHSSSLLPVYGTRLSPTPPLPNFFGRMEILASAHSHLLSLQGSQGWQRRVKGRVWFGFI